MTAEPTRPQELGFVRFRVKAAFYFFVAQYISTNLSATDVQVVVKELASKLYREDAANIVLFLCHLPQNAIVRREVLASAKATFSDVQELTFSMM